MKIQSVQWDELLGVCVKHGLPTIPCPQCLAGRDEDIEVVLSDIDVLTLEDHPGLAVIDLLPKDHADWLVGRVVLGTVLY